jgi:hypothetical protein
MLVTAVWFLWYTTDGVSWKQIPLGFPSQERCQGYATTIDQLQGHGAITGVQCRVDTSRALRKG